MKVIDNPAHLHKRCSYLYQGKQPWGGPFSLPEHVSNAAGGASSGLFFPNARSGRVARSPVTSPKSGSPVLRCRLFLLRSSSGWRQQQVPPCERGKCKGRRKFLPPTDRRFFFVSRQTLAEITTANITCEASGQIVYHDRSRGMVGCAHREGRSRRLPP